MTDLTAVSRPEAGRATRQLFDLFLGQAPFWYKVGLLACLAFNTWSNYALGPFVTGWLILFQFIGTLALTLYCSPLLSGGLLLLQTMALGLAPMEAVHEEIAYNLPILFLVLFVVTAVHFLKDLLAFVFVKAILGIRSEMLLGLFFLITPAVLSAMLDALTVMAVVIAVFAALYAVYHKHASERGQHEHHDHTSDAAIRAEHREELEGFRAALRRLVMLSAIGTMLGGISTLIGEPQNLLIGKVVGWDFNEFFVTMLPVSVPVFASGAVVCYLLQRAGWHDFGATLSPAVRAILEEEADRQARHRTPTDTMRMTIQAIGALTLVAALILHIGEVYVIGLMVLIIVTSLTGRTEHEIGEAVKEGGPFVFVLAIFFGIVAMIHSQHLFAPVTAWVLGFEGAARLVAYYVATGVLSAVSDNVFVASLFITEVESLHVAGEIARDEYERIAVAINMGTNIPSISTPNGQAAFLFLLMAPLAPLIRLSYLRMMLLAAPFAVVCSLVGVAAVALL